MSQFQSNDNDSDNRDDDNDTGEIDEALLATLRPEALAALLDFRNNNDTNNNDDKSNDDDNRSPYPVSNKVFAEKSYWEERFKDEDNYEWLLGYKDIKSNIESYMKHSDTILIVGCGNSNFSLELYDNGFTNIVNIDFSEVVIDRMKKANELNRPMMKWLVMDMTSMTFDTNAFDVVIDKASMDALCVDEGDVWDPKDDVINSVHRMCTDISRILKPKGYFLSLSFAQPHFRTKYLNGSRTSENSRCIDNPYEIMKGKCDQYNWTLNYEKISKELGTFEFYLYLMEKGE